MAAGASILAVTTPAPDLSLLTIEELRKATGVGDNSEDADLEALGRRVAAAIARECKVSAAGVTPPTLRQETLTEIFRPTDAFDELLLARRPIVSVVSIVEDLATLQAADYEIVADAGYIRRLCDDRVTLWSAEKITVVYAAGWDVVPDDLSLAAAKLAAVFWTEGRKIDPSLKRVKIEGISEREYWVPPTSDPAIPREVCDLLRDFYHHSIW
jgi:hypothetical protein